MWSLLGGHYYEKGRRVRRRTQLPEDFNRTSHWKLKREAVDPSLWIRRLGSYYRIIERQTRYNNNNNNNNNNYRVSIREIDTFKVM